MEDFTTFEQAQRLKELGFDWDCNHYYQDNNQSLHPNFYENFNKHSKLNIEDEVLTKVTLSSAPTLAQAQKWVREVKGIIICIEPKFYRNKKPLMGYDYRLFNKDDGWYSYIESKTVYDTYEEALQVGIYKALELLG